jgi:hypothetical protein
MSLDSVHPLYSNYVPDWVQLRDFALGERAVKAKRETYLPATKGMKLDGMGPRDLGREVYDAYLLRASFPEYIMDALEIFMGMLHNKSAVIELPTEMEPLREKCTELGEPIEILLQRINLEQLITGRLGLLLDLPENPDPRNPLPFIALYIAEAIRNWDTNDIMAERAELQLVVLDESGYRRTENFQWQIARKFRVLRLMTTTAGTSRYMCAQFVDPGGAVPTYDETQLRTPAYRGQELDSIPFVFINARDISPDPGVPPLIGLARLCGTIYRSEADYRQNLFMQGQDTLVVVGDRRIPADATGAPEEPLRTGAGSRIDLEVGGTAEYIGVNSQGLSEQRYALENDRKRAEVRSGQLIDASKGDKESGTALRTRVGAQTATLNQIAKTGALALELLLKRCAMWMRADPNKVKVTPNLEFADYQMSGQDLTNLMTAKRSGAPLSRESIHRLMVQGNLTSYDYVTEEAKIKEEPPLPAPSPTSPGAPGQGPAPRDPENPAPEDN